MQPSKNNRHKMEDSLDPKIQEQKNQLSHKGWFRAAHLWEVFGDGQTTESAYSSPNVIYAMKAGDVRASTQCDARLCLQCIEDCRNLTLPSDPLAII